MDNTMEMEKQKREELEKIHGAHASHGEVMFQNETDIADHEENESEDSFDESEKHTDYSDFSKKQLVDHVKELVNHNNFKKVDQALKEIKHFYDELRDRERSEALQRFVADGGTEEDFDYKGDELDASFDFAYKTIKDKRTQYFREQEDAKQANLLKKEEILEKIRQLVDTPEATQQFEAFKELQKEWKAVGPVPGVQAKTLWANYHALVDRFYDNQSIYFELKELDRKKNLEAKQELCNRAERLAQVEIIKDAIRELNELHHEFKHIGPVPKEEKEAIWQRFKAASDAVYARRDEYLQNLQQELNVNLEKKAQLSEEVQQFISFQSDRIKEWNQKTKEILEVQKKWEEIGGLPRAKAKEVNKKFWLAFKTFFNNKNAFFKKLDEEREENLRIKSELVQKALELKESHDWAATSNELKSLQARWKEVGPVPERHRERIFKEFKEACDHFFEQRRNQHGKVEEEQESNLRQKIAICEELERHVMDNTASQDLLHQLQDRYNAIGFVPRKELANVRNRYAEAVDKFMGVIPGLSEEDKGRLQLENQLGDLKNDPFAEKKLFQKEQVIRKKITKVENDIAVWRNNLEFFGHSKNAEKYREEFNEKIKEASDHLKQLKQQLKLLRTVS